MSMNIVQQIHTTGTPAQNGAPLSGDHRHMLEVESGIDAREIEARGYWTAYSAADIPAGFAEYQYRADMFPILVIPQYNLTGRRFGYVLRPDRPRKNRETGKPIKYESQPGGRVGFDINPLMVDKLRDPSVPICMTEGSKKADAAASRGVVCVSLNGVYGFMSRRVIVSELDEIELDGREVRIVFDDDVMTKPGPADALDRLSGALDRRGAKVQRVILTDPTNPGAAPGTAKIGLDDYFVKGGTPDTLSRLSTPWEGTRRPANIVEYPDPYERIAELEADNRALVLLVKNPYLSHSQKVFLVQAGTRAMSAASHGKVDDEGQVTLTAGEISQDYRPKPERGEAKAKVNPDGSLFLMPRSTAKSTAKQLKDDLKLITFKAGPVTITRKNGAEYTDTGIIVSPPKSLAELIEPAARYVPEEYQPRADYTKPVACPSCGEVHARTVKVVRTTTCGTDDDPGCGAVIGEKHQVIKLPVPASGRADLTEEQRERLDNQTQDREAKTEETGMVTKNVTIEEQPIADPLIPPSNVLVTKNVTMPESTPSPPVVRQSHISQCGYRTFVDGAWHICTNNTAGNAFYCDDHAAPVEGVAS